jgi:hypothetical protein
LHAIAITAVDKVNSGDEDFAAQETFPEIKTGDRLAPLSRNSFSTYGRRISDSKLIKRVAPP